MVSYESPHYNQDSFKNWGIEIHIGKYLLDKFQEHGFTSFTVEHHSTLEAAYPTFIILWTGNKKSWRVLLKYSVDPVEPQNITEKEKQYMEELWQTELGTNYFLPVKLEQNLMAIPNIHPVLIS